MTGGVRAPPAPFRQVLESIRRAWRMTGVCAPIVQLKCRSIAVEQAMTIAWQLNDQRMRYPQHTFGRLLGDRETNCPALRSFPCEISFTSRKVKPCK